MPTDAIPRDWETELAELLVELSSVQDDMLSLLQKKREQMMAPDAAVLEQSNEQQRQVCARLEACYQRRQQMLEAAQAQGLPAASIRQLTASLKDVGPEKRAQFGDQIERVSGRMRLLQHHSLTNWVLAQRSLLHLTQILEIIATGGRLKPTYGDDSSAAATGALVDRAA
jgi:hypothetical protein